MLRLFFWALRNRPYDWYSTQMAWIDASFAELPDSRGSVQLWFLRHEGAWCTERTSGMGLITVSRNPLRVNAATPFPRYFAYVLTVDTAVVDIPPGYDWEQEETPRFAVLFYIDKVWREDNADGNQE